MTTPKDYLPRAMKGQYFKQLNYNRIIKHVTKENNVKFIFNIIN